MRKCTTYECKRKALGLTQAEVGQLAGVSSSAVSNFERGDELSTPVWRSIIMAIDNEMKKLDRTTYCETVLTAQVLQLAYESDEEKLVTLGYILMNASKLQLDLFNKKKEEERTTYPWNE